MGAEVASWLEGAGLARYAGNFAGMDARAFRALLMQDYGRYGVTALEDKQRLFRLLKAKRSEASREGGAPGASRGEGAAAAALPGAGAPPGTPPRATRARPASRQAAARAAAERQKERGGSGAPAAPARDEGGAKVEGPAGGATAARPPLSPLRAGRAQEAPARDAPPAMGPRPERLERPESAPPASRGASGGSRAGAGGRSGTKIKVCVRKRPLNRKEEERGEDAIVDMATGTGGLTVHEPKVKVDLTKYTDRHAFQFDAVFDESTSNEALYQETVAPLVPGAFQGGRSTCFAFGQTGSGKTYTMRPLPRRCAQDMFLGMGQPDHAGLELWLSVYEIYGGKVFDLLNDRNLLVMREDGKKNVNVVGLQETRVESPDEVQALMQAAEATRVTGSTGANAESSRSHCIAQFALKRAVSVADPRRSSVGGLSGAGEVRRIVVGKVSFIDLAGSERGADTDENDKQTRLEGAEINKSLLALKECIRALDQQARHVPFRGSKLTEVLRDSFVGPKSRTVMIATVSPSSGSCENSLNTLRYADRVKEMRRASGSVSGSGGGGSAGAVQPPQTAGQPAPPVLPPPEVQPIAPRGDKGRAAVASKKEGGKGEEVNSGNVLHEHQKRNQAEPAPGGRSRGASKTGKTENGKSGAENVVPAPKAPDTLGEEEILIASHRQSIEDTMEFVRKEMTLLADVDQPGSSLESYIKKLGTLLKQRQDGITTLQKRLKKLEARSKRRNRA